MTVFKARLSVVILLLPVASGCSRVENTFEIDDPSGSVTSAELRLCGSRVMLNRSGVQFRGSQRARCEDDGVIAVRLSDGSETSCPIGYVTAGAAQDFKFVVEKSQCRVVLDAGDASRTSPR